MKTKKTTLSVRIDDDQLEKMIVASLDESKARGSLITHNQLISEIVREWLAARATKAPN